MQAAEMILVTTYFLCFDCVVYGRRFVSKSKLHLQVGVCKTGSCSKSAKYIELLLVQVWRDLVPALLLEIEEEVFNQQVKLAPAGKSSEQIINQQLIGDYA